MKALYYCQDGDDSLLCALREHLPDHEIYNWSNDTDIPFADISTAIVWLPPADFFDKLDNLEYVYALSAGVDHLLTHPGLPPETPVVRLEDAGMGSQMAEYVLYGALHAQRKMHELRLAQASAQWHHHITVQSAQDTQVSVLGAGALGAIVAERLAINGFKVSCWSRSPRALSAMVSSAHGESALPELLSRTHILVCMLPLTETTKGILNATLFRQMPAGAYLINPGRGAHLVDEDLLSALDSGQLSGALLDVFIEEPLNTNHPFWQHPRITVTPHVAAKSLPLQSAAQISNNIMRVERGEPPAGLIERARGY